MGGKQGGLGPLVPPAAPGSANAIPARDVGGLQTPAPIGCIASLHATPWRAVI